MTTLTETDTYALMQKLNGDDGGLDFYAFTDTNKNAMQLIGIAASADTTKTTSGEAPVVVDGRVKSGTTWASPGADGNLFVVADFGSARMIVDVEGDILVDGASTLTTFDDYNDAELVRTLDTLTSDHWIQTEWDSFIKYNENDLIQAKILGAPLVDGGLLNVTKLQKLHNGAIWQLHCQIQEERQARKQLENKVMSLEMGGSNAP